MEIGIFPDAGASAGAQPVRRDPVGPRHHRAGRPTGLRRRPGSASTSPCRGSRSARPTCCLAQALLRTKSIKLAPGAHLLPYHHPVELAHRVAYFDHLAQGRFMLGVGASGIPGDWALFDVDGQNGEHREMTREALEIMLARLDRRRAVGASRKVLERQRNCTDVRRLDEAAHQALPEAAPTDRRHRLQRGLRNAQARRRTRLPADEPRPQRRIRRHALGRRAGRRRREADAHPIGATGGWCARSWSPKPTNRHSVTPSTA